MEILEAMKLIDTGKGENIPSDLLVEMAQLGWVTGLKDVSHLGRDGYIVGLDTELTRLGKEQIHN